MIGQSAGPSVGLTRLRTVPSTRRGYVVDQQQRGLSMSTSFAVIMPVLLLMIFGVIQGGIWWHGRRVAEQAVNTGADIARSHGGDTTHARQAARRVAASGGLHEVHISIHRSTDQVRVTMTGQTAMPLDLGWGSITETATAPTERITQP